MEKQKLYISVDVDKEGMLGKIATAIKLEDELRDVLNEIKREIHLKEEQEDYSSSRMSITSSMRCLISAPRS